MARSALRPCCLPPHCAWNTHSPDPPEPHHPALSSREAVLATSLFPCRPPVTPHSHHPNICIYLSVQPLSPQRVWAPRGWRPRGSAWGSASTAPALSRCSVNTWGMTSTFATAFSTRCLVQVLTCGRAGIGPPLTNYQGLPHTRVTVVAEGLNTLNQATRTAGLNPCCNLKRNPPVPQDDREHSTFIRLMCLLTLPFPERH